MEHSVGHLFICHSEPLLITVVEILIYGNHLRHIRATWAVVGPMLDITCHTYLSR